MDNKSYHGMKVKLTLFMHSEHYYLIDYSIFKGFLNAGEMPRRNRISLEHRGRIVRGFEDEEEDYLVVADTLGVNRSTARGIVARYIREGRIQERPRGVRNNCREEIINENCLYTLARINSELKRRLPQKPQIHNCTMARTLDGCFPSETCKAPPCGQKQTWCDEQASGLRHLIYEPCRSAPLCVCRRMRLQHLDGQKPR